MYGVNPHEQSRASSVAMAESAGLVTIVHGFKAGWQRGLGLAMLQNYFWQTI